MGELKNKPFTHAGAVVEDTANFVKRLLDKADFGEVEYERNLIKKQVMDSLKEVYGYLYYLQEQATPKRRKRVATA